MKNKMFRHNQVFICSIFFNHKNLMTIFSVIFLVRLCLLFINVIGMFIENLKCKKIMNIITNLKFYMYSFFVHITVALKSIIGQYSIYTL